MSAGVHIYFSSWSQSASQKVRTYLQTTASQTEGYIVCLLAMAMWLVRSSYAGVPTCKDAN